ncbi:MAG TPA: DUF2232 domain-containing protein [Gemmatimonadaceae bacterium]|jgi:hypothetical protein|nr:DUF2232 domain-containing protein [Gemmatimonadaceae bacterium]
MTSPARATPEPLSAVAPPPASRERGWRGVLGGLVALILLPTIPQLRLLTPVDQVLLLIAPTMAVCAVAAWWRGGRISFALLWLVLAAWIVAGPVRASDSFAMLARAWCVVLAGTFGVMHVVMPRHRFLPRALGAIAATTMIALVVLAASGNGFQQLHTVVVSEIDRRLAASVDMVTQAMSSPQWQRLAQSSPTFAKFAEDSTLQLQQFASVAKSVYAAVLAIESLAALAVTWALFHRVSRARIGAPLAPLREFRFSDQMVWGLVVSIVLLVLPTFSGLRAMGLNLLIFFGALYALRGFGVLAWYFASHKVGLVLVMIVAILALPLTSLFSIGVGLGDTWLDWRGRPRVTPRPPSPPQ